ncbi:MAG: methionine--tRNA ligase subunit beta [Planctomycetes bacterium]|nr:methionine--tRNA ligase subunit beta [Planctomycetota bacterium]
MTDAPTPAAGPAMITIDDFRKLDLKIGKILEVADHTNANKLYVIKVDVGGEVRQLVAGIKPYYQPGDLVGKSVVVVANLQPALLRGVESQGMLLAAHGNETVSILTPLRELPPGSKVS